MTPARESAMKPVGKPDAGNPHVRFDERDGKRASLTGQHRAHPRLYQAVPPAVLRLCSVTTETTGRKSWVSGVMGPDGLSRRQTGEFFV